MADEIDRLIRGFWLRGASAAIAWKLGVVMDLERLHDDRIMPFLLNVLVNHGEPTEVRIHVRKRIRNGGLAPDNRVLVAEVLARLLGNDSNADLRMQAALALGEFTEVAGVLPALGKTATDQNAPLDLRYGAFTSLERAGPTLECIAVLRQLSHDETLGRAARSALLAWRVHDDSE